MTHDFIQSLADQLQSIDDSAGLVRIFTKHFRLTINRLQAHKTAAARLIVTGKLLL